MKKEKAPAIGTCPCPESGCAHVIEVRKYQERSGRGSMFKGKFYGNCPAHGRVIDASRPASQEHVLERGEIWGARAASVSAQTEIEEPCKTIQPAPQAPEPIQEPAKPVTRPPAVLPAPRRVQSITETAPVRLTWQGWNLWDWWPMPPSD